MSDGYIQIIIAVLSIFSYEILANLRSKRKSNESNISFVTKTEEKLEIIVKKLDEVYNNSKATEISVQNNKIEIAKLQESTKSLHRRLDEHLTEGGR